MTGQITLIGKTWKSTKPVTIETHPASEQDADGLSKLYFTAYEDGQVGSQAEALELMHEFFAGKYGSVLSEASPVVTDEHGRVIAAALVLERRDDKGVPETPFIFELFTASSRRREGFAEQLLRQSISTLHELGYPEVALRIDEDNAAALALYLTLDFNRWVPESEDSLY